jgi:hypothetical protein
MSRGKDSHINRQDRDRLRRDIELRQVKSPSAERISEAEKLTAVIAERIAEVLPGHGFQLKLVHPIISVNGVGEMYGNGYSTAPAIIWYLQLPASQRLQMIFENQARELQRFLSNVRGEPWPGQRSQPHVHVTASMIHAWWGGSAEADAVVRLRPISRAEVGV